MSAKTGDKDTDKKTKPAPGTGHEGQTFLVGDAVYLRPVETDDAGVGMSWRQTPFPLSKDRVETWVKEEMPKDHQTRWFAIVRKADDRVVGSVKYHRDGSDTFVRAQVDALFGDQGQRWKGEALNLAVPWLVDEQQRPSARTEIPASEQIVIGMIESIGMRKSAQFREMLLINGERVDNCAYEYLNTSWIENIGDPRDMELERTGTGEARPVPPKVTLDGDPPQNAIMAGKRVYLRPEQKSDGAAAALNSRRETETFFDIGRYMESEVHFGQWAEKHQKLDWPTWIWFSVCLRETDEMIGSVGLIDVDYVNRHAETGSFFQNIAYRGSGYGSEAKHLLLEYAFDVLGLHMVLSWVFNQNTRSAAALRKQGYTERGSVNWLYTNKGKLDGFVVFDLMAAEWRALPRRAWDDTSTSD